MDKRIVYSQNFLINKKLVSELIAKSSITPFNLTSEIIHKLTETLNPPEDIYLIVQKETALKFLDKTLASLLLKPDFDLNIIYEFKRKDFQPTPRVDCVMLRIKKREISLIAEADKNYFRDFIAYSFSHWKKKVSPTSLSFDQWLEIFNKFNKDRSYQLRLRRGFQDDEKT